MSRFFSRVPIWLTRNIFVFGVVSCLTDLSSEMLIPLLPAFLLQIGGGPLALGWIEGAADGLSNLLKLFAGHWSDRRARRRPLVWFGYGVSSVVRPLMAVATAPWHVLLVRLTDRVGKGIRTSPRDALIAAAVPTLARARAFSFDRIMDHAGAVLGPLAALWCLAYWTHDVRKIFMLAAAPGAIVMLVLGFGLRETDASAQSQSTPLRWRWPDVMQRKFLVPLGIFTLGNASDLFLLLKAGGDAQGMTRLPLLWIALHLVKILSSAVGGRCADRYGLLSTITAGWGVHIVVYGTLAFVQDPHWVWGLCALYGVYHGLIEGPEKALMSRLSASDAQGDGFGWYHVVSGLLLLPASALFGWLWSHFGNSVAFGADAALASIGLAVLLVTQHFSAEKMP